MADIEQDLILQEALQGSPDWYDIPEEMEEQIRGQVSARERFFWLSAGRIEDDLVTRSLLRRALYAEVRCYESESRLAEMALITKAAKEQVESLQRQVQSLADATDKDADLSVRFEVDHRGEST